MKAKAFSILAAGVLAALPTVAISSSAQAEELPHSQLTADGCSDFYYNAEWGIEPPRHPWFLDCGEIEEVVRTIGVPVETKNTDHWTKIQGWGDHWWGYKTFADFDKSTKTVSYSQYFSIYSFEVKWNHH